MKVTGYGNIKPAISTRKRDGANAVSNFSDFLQAAQSSTESAVTEVNELASASNIGNLLALQEISEEERRRERMFKKGANMLAILERLRDQLLIGEIPEKMLYDLSGAIAAQKEQTSDIQLLALIEEIELRVAVELAKLEMAFASRSEI